MARRRVSQERIERQEEMQRRAEELGGEWVIRGGRVVLLTKTIRVDTTALTNDEKSEIALEYYHDEKQWRGTHNYTKQLEDLSSSSAYTGWMTTKEVRQYLTKLKGNVAKAKIRVMEDLNKLDNDLSQTLVDL